jgi:myo-inositol-1(or 4)-monophosphatase
MQHNDTANYTPFIKTVLAGAAQIALEHHGKVTASTKPGDNNQVLTEADLAIGQYILQQLQQTYPTHNSIDEEAGVVDNGSDYTWVVDPVDGTSNFAAGLPHYGILLGLLHHGTAVAGGIALPAYGELYVAAKGEGAFCNDQKIRVTTETELANVLVAYGIDGHQENPGQTYQEAEQLASIVLAIRNLRSSNSTYDTALTAKGAYGASLNRTSKIWDNVAQQVVVEEAGGLYTDFFGKPIDYSNPLTRVDQNFTYCAASPALHEQLQAVLGRSAG